MKIAITTSSFGKFSAEPLSLLKEKGLSLDDFVQAPVGPH